MVHWRSSFWPQNLPSFPPPTCSSCSPLTHLCSISSAVPPSQSTSATSIFLASDPFSSVYPCLPHSHHSWVRTHHSLRVSDPFQGDKLLSAACLHSWKIKDLWGHEGSAYLCECVREGSGGSHTWLRTLKVENLVAVCESEEVKPSYFLLDRAADDGGHSAISPSNALMTIAAFMMFLSLVFVSISFARSSADGPTWKYRVHCQMRQNTVITTIAGFWYYTGTSTVVLKSWLQINWPWFNTIVDLITEL